ncbi:MAG: GerMN domain-containing protein [bacterium]|nr:GerMN domain-containing protein [bacterium]
MNKKIITIVALVAVIIIGGVLVYSASQGSNDVPVVTPTDTEPSTTTPSVNPITDTPTPSDTSTRTYRNETYGFEFKYPSIYRNSTAERSSNVPIVTLEKTDSAIGVKNIVRKSGQTYQQALIADVIYDGSGEHPKSFSEFKTRQIKGNTFHWIVVGRFEGIIMINYYLDYNGNILVFTTQTRNVEEWTDPSFNIENDVTHVDLKTILETFRLFTPSGNTVKLFFSNPKSPEFKNSCGATTKVTRLIPKTQSIADATLKALFSGPTDAEKTIGLTSSINPDHYLGIIVRNGVATVNFKKEALEYLNGAACMQETVKAPIEQTLKQFSTIKSVEYAIDGKVFTEWDA